MKRTLLALARLLLSRDALHTYAGAGSLYGIWWGMAQVHRPSAWILISSLLLCGVVYARTKGQG